MLHNKLFTHAWDLLLQAISGLDNKSFELVASRATTYENLVARLQKLVARMKNK